MAKTFYELQQRRQLLCDRIAANLDILMGSVTTKGPKRPGYNLTFKIRGVTRSRHIRKEDLEKVRLMTRRHKTLKRIKDVEPTNNHAERSVRPLVIMRKICMGTRSPVGSQRHSTLASLLTTARRQGKDDIAFLIALLTQSPATAQRALFADSG